MNNTPRSGHRSLLDDRTFTPPSRHNSRLPLSNINPLSPLPPTRTDSPYSTPRSRPSLAHPITPPSRHTYPPYVDHHPINLPRPSPPPLTLLPWLSRVLSLPSPPPLDDSLTSDQLLHWLEQSKVAPRTMIAAGLSDGLWDLFPCEENGYDRQVGEVRGGRFSGFCIRFCADNGRVAVDEKPPDYEAQVKKVEAAEREGLPVPDAVARVRPVEVNEARCTHPGCTTSLSLSVNTRHHCRACGHSVCKEHSRYLLPLLRLYYPQGGHGQKVCKLCWMRDAAQARWSRGKVILGSIDGTAFPAWSATLLPVDGKLYQGTGLTGDRANPTGVGSLHRARPPQLYEGELVDGQAHGMGRQLYFDKDDRALPRTVWKYNVAADDQKERPEWWPRLHTGPRTAVAVYEGGWKEGQRHGYGALSTHEWQYEGQWEDGEMTSPWAEVRWWRGERYVGPVTRGQRMATDATRGWWIRPSCYYYGPFKDDRATGVGVSQYTDGDYCGEHVDGLRHGRGEMRFTVPVDGATERQGEWKEDQHVEGVVYYAGGAMYTGKTLMQGRGFDVKGHMVYANEDVYEGGFHNGLRHGEGTYWYATGKQAQQYFKGRWYKGRRRGREGGEVWVEERGEVYAGPTTYQPGLWFNGQHGPEQPLPEEMVITFSSHLQPDLPWLSRHGEAAGVMVRSVQDGVVEMKGRWECDRQVGEGEWQLLSAPSALRLTLTAKWTSMHGPFSPTDYMRSSHMQGPVLLRSTGPQPPLPGFKPELELQLASITPCLTPISGPARPCPYLVAASLEEPMVPQVVIDGRRQLLGAACLRRDGSCLLPALWSTSVVSALFGFCSVTQRTGAEQWTGLMLAGRAEGWGRRMLQGPQGVTLQEGQWEWGRRQGLGRAALPDGSRYLGDYDDDVRRGLGRWTVANWTFDGQFDRQPHGSGRLMEWLTHQRSRVYEGQMLRGCVSGVGQLQLPQGVLYRGEWRDGRPHGCGQLSNAVAEYTGQFEQGQCTGRGKLHVRAAEVQQLGRVELLYEGQLLQGCSHGQGCMLLRVLSSFTSSSSISTVLHYRGAFLQGRFHGTGAVAAYQWPSAEALPEDILSPFLHAAESALRTLTPSWSYSGSWLHGIRHGMGELEVQLLSYPTKPPLPLTESTPGRCYLGTFVHDQPRGYGRLTQPLPSVPAELDFCEYTGAVENALRSGFGSSRLWRGEQHTGSYQQGVMHGSGRLLMANGDAYRGCWTHGRLGGAGEYHFSSTGRTHLVPSAECFCVAGRLQGSCLLRLQSSPTSPPASAVVGVHVEFDAQSRLSTQHWLRLVYQDGSTYTGDVLFCPALADAASSSITARSLADFNGLLDLCERCLNLPQGTAADDRLLRVLLQQLQTLTSLPSVDALLALWGDAGPFFPLCLLAEAVSHSRLVRQGLGRFERQQPLELYTGVWTADVQGSDPQGQWTRAAAPLWPGLLAEETQYSGGVEDGRMHGLGTLLFPSSHLQLTTHFTHGQPNLSHARLDDHHAHSSYTGALTPALQYEGVGELQLAAMAPFRGHRGEFKGGVAHGWGEREGALGVWTGEFWQGQQHGRGVWRGRDALQFVGRWSHDVAVAVTSV